jgi:prefoldin subunit 5
MTSEDIVRLDQRVVGLEATIQNLSARVAVLEQALAAANSKVETLNTFYGGSLQTLTERLLTNFEKAAGTQTP